MFLLHIKTQHTAPRKSQRLLPGVSVWTGVPIQALAKLDVEDFSASLSLTSSSTRLRSFSASDWDSSSRSPMGQSQKHRGEGSRGQRAAWPWTTSSDTRSTLWEQKSSSLQTLGCIYTASVGAGPQDTLRSNTTTTKTCSVTFIHSTRTGAHLTGYVCGRWTKQKGVKGSNRM